MTSHKKRDLTATIGGLLTALVTALVVIDFNTWDYRKPNDWIKVLAIALPIIGGYYSQIKTSK